MIKIEYENAENLPFLIKVEESEALEKIIQITAEGGMIHYVSRIE